MSSASPQQPEMSDARKRAEARKAKILARGGAGLAKLASTARGEEASMLYDTNTPPRSSTSTPIQSKPTSDRPSQPTSASTSTSNNTSSFPSTDPSLDYQRQLEQMMSMLGASAGGAPPGPAGGGLDDPAGAEAFQKLLSGMMGANAGAGGVGGGGFPSFPGLPGIGAGNSEFDLAQMDPEADPPSPTIPASLPPGFPSFPSSSQQPYKATFVFRLLPLIHFVTITLFFFFTLLVWEPRVRVAKGGLEGVVDGAVDSLGGWRRWGVMGWEKGWSSVRAGSVTQVPVFWAFVTLELILQTTRFMLLKSSPPPPNFLTNYLPLLPPKISSPILIVTRYAHLLNQTYKDGCLLLLLYGITVVAAGR